MLEWVSNSLVCVMCVVDEDELQHTATHCSTLQYTATHCNTLQCTATHCNTLQHAATHCNTLQHAATPDKDELHGRDAAKVREVAMSGKKQKRMGADAEKDEASQERSEEEIAAMPVIHIYI